MKTKAFLLVCLFLGIGLTQVSAQKGTDKTYSEWVERSWSDPVYCDGELVDWLDCTLTMHHVAKFVKGEWLHCWGFCSGTAVSQATHETFKIREMGKQDNNIQSNGEWLPEADVHYNAIGEFGTHYIVFFTMKWDGTDLTYESTRSVCLRE
jgi:hypothetical protein